MPVMLDNTTIYVVTYENDGDSPICEIVLVTNNKHKAYEKAQERGDEYALSHIIEWDNDVKKTEYILDGSEDDPHIICWG